MCIRCKNIFDDGTDLLKGCPSCGWKKFMFTKKGADLPGAETHLRIKATSTFRMVRNTSPSKERVLGAKRTDARSKEAVPPLVQEKELYEANHPDDAKIESIKITAPGTYELNLSTLFKRDELIMAVKEGIYLIDLSSAFRKKKE